MLTLRVESGDYVAIGDNIFVQVYQVKDSTFALSIDAPKEVPIVRGELHEKTAACPESIRQRWQQHPPRKPSVRRFSAPDRH